MTGKAHQNSYATPVAAMHAETIQEGYVLRVAPVPDCVYAIGIGRRRVCVT